MTETVPLLPLHLLLARTGKYLHIYSRFYNKTSAFQSSNALVCSVPYSHLMRWSVLCLTVI
jgi:hypothetical protein